MYIYYLWLHNTLLYEVPKSKIPPIVNVQKGYWKIEPYTNIE